MKTLVALLLASVALVGCQKQAEESQRKGDFKVEKLFTFEGCSVYRFYDDRTVYYSNCNGSTQSTYNCGKGCSRNDVVTTTKD
jgi:hypothetical protein